METNNPPQIGAIDLEDYDTGIEKLAQLHALLVSLSGPQIDGFMRLSQPIQENVLSLATSLARDAHSLLHQSSA